LTSFRKLGSAFRCFERHFLGRLMALFDFTASMISRLLKVLINCDL